MGRASTPKKKGSGTPAKRKAPLVAVAKRRAVERVDVVTRHGSAFAIHDLLIKLGDAVPADARRVIFAVLKSMREDDVDALKRGVGGKSVAERARLYLHGTRGTVLKQWYVEHLAENWSKWPDEWRITYAVQGVRNGLNRARVSVPTLTAKLRKKLLTHPALSGEEVAAFLLRAAGHANPLAFQRKRDKRANCDHVPLSSHHRGTP